VSATSTHIAAYRRLTVLYPRRFRDEYRTDLIALFSHQLHDDGPGRVWLRTARDIAVTVPVQHLEVHVHRPSNHIVTAASSVIAVAAALLAITMGTATSLVLLVVALGSGAIAVSSWKANRPLRVTNNVDSAWWKFLAGGVALVIVTFSAMAVPWPDAMDLGDNAYWLVVFSVMTGLALGTIGLALGLGALIHRKYAPRPAG
jgi:hypothetical protein